MTHLQQRLFDLVRRAGPNGLAGDDLMTLLYMVRLPPYAGGNKQKRSRLALKSVVWTVNKKIRARGLRIHGSHCHGGWYWLKNSP